MNFDTSTFNIKIQLIMRINIILAVFAYICVVYFASCRNDGVTSGRQSVKWDCSRMTTDSFDSRELFKSVELIPLETTDKSLLGRVDKAVFFDSVVIVMDKTTAGNICVFNAKTGKYLWKFGSYGKGRGEYIRLNDFSIDENSQSIYVLSERNKMMKFDINGKFVDQKIMPFYSTAFEVSEGRFYFVCGTQSEYNLYVTDTDFNIKSEHFPMSDFGDNYVQCIHPLQKTADGILYNRNLDNNIYSIDASGNISVKYAIDLGPDSIKFAMLKDKHIDIKKLMKRSACDVKYFADGQRFAYIMFYVNGKATTSVYDKKNASVIVCKDANMKDGKLGLLFPILEFVNEKGDMVSAVSGSDIAKLAKNGILDSTKYSEDSNPILCIYK